jgi:hypothetical protein
MPGEEWGLHCRGVKPNLRRFEMLLARSRRAEGVA